MTWWLMRRAKGKSKCFKKSPRKIQHEKFREMQKWESESGGGARKAHSAASNRSFRHGIPSDWITWSVYVYGIQSNFLLNAQWKWRSWNHWPTRQRGKGSGLVIALVFTSLESFFFFFETCPEGPGIDWQVLPHLFFFDVANAIPNYKYKYGIIFLFLFPFPRGNQTPNLGAICLCLRFP